MILNHLNLTVTDVPAARRFLETYPATFHIGFIQPTEAAVDALHARLKADGFDADPPARSHAWSFYVKAPGGFVVEVLC